MHPSFPYNGGILYALEQNQPNVPLEAKVRNGDKVQANKLLQALVYVNSLIKHML